MHSPRKSHELIGLLGAVALALAVPGSVQAYPTMPDGEPIHVADKPGRLPSVQRSYSTMPPEGIEGLPVVEPTEKVFHPARTTGETSSSRWSGAAEVAAVSILAALAALAATHVLNRQLRRSTTTRRIGG